MSPAQLDTDVLVVGAGPTGLVLALWLSHLGVRPRLIDKAAGPGTTSRALAVQARTLELYAQVGLAQAVIEAGWKLEAANVWASGRKAVRVAFGAMGRGASPYPFALIYPQDEHERLLIERLAERGVHVERGTELLAFDDSGAGVAARLRRSDGSLATCSAAWLAGCDGARSEVREGLHAGFPGGTYAQMFYVADVQASGPTIDGELHVALDAGDFLATFPLAQPGHARLIGTVREAAMRAGKDFGWEDVSARIVQRMRVKVERVNWFSTYHVHHRVARIFQAGHAFLLGDAAHIHSPVGGQGMNTGIGDAVNLAWKLAAVLQGRADEALLASYATERRAFACRLVATTDRAFTFITRNGAIARFVRLHVAPRVLAALFQSAAVRRAMFRTISQIGVSYRECDFNAGAAGGVKGGDRLPWIALQGSSALGNFAPLASLAWQVHVYGTPRAGLTARLAARNLALHAFAWRPAMGHAGVARNALYLVRPDGYVAFADAVGDAAALESYLDRKNLRP